MLLSLLCVPESRTVQAIPSLEVRTVPLSPAATNRSRPCVTPRKPDTRRDGPWHDAPLVDFLSRDRRIHFCFHGHFLSGSRWLPQSCCLFHPLLKEMPKKVTVRLQPRILMA